MSELEVNVEPQVVHPSRDVIGEGPIWDERARVFYWIDIFGNCVHALAADRGGYRCYDVGQAIGTVVPRRRGGLMLALHHGFAAFDLDSGDVTPVADPEHDLPSNRFNDGKCDPAGRFWAGTMDFHAQGVTGSLYCLDVDGTVSRKLTDVGVSNGIAWSHDGATMYFIDTVRNTVVAYDFDLRPSTFDLRLLVTATRSDGGRI